MVSLWRECKLGDVMTLQRGYDLPERERREGHVPIVSSSGITGFHSEAKALAPGVVTGRYGTLGEVFYITQDYWPLNTALFVKDFKGNEPRFVAYLLRTVGLARQNAAGAVPGVNRNHLHALDVRVPSLALQRRIADILAAYDDLIENNTKRIKILEEMTSVAFSLMEAGASAATERALGDIVDEAGGVVRTGPFGSALHESDYTAEGSPVVMPKNLIAGRIDTSDIARIPDEVVEKLAQHKLSVGDIVYGRRGDIGRRAFIGKRQVGWLCGTGCLRISLPLGGPLHPRYLHEYLGKPDVVAGIAGAAVGATMPNLNTSILRAVPVTVPDTTTQSRFSEVALVNDDLIEVLRSANGVLRAQRDLLLPRLISGEVALDTAVTDRTAPRAHGKPSRVSDRVAADTP